AMGQPEGIDRLIFGTFGLLLAALAPAALARVVGAPELQTAVQSMSGGSKLLALGAGAMAAKGALGAVGAGAGSVGRARARNGASALEGVGPGGSSGGALPGGGPTGGGSSGGRGGGPGGGAGGSSSGGGRSASRDFAPAG